MSITLENKIKILEYKLIFEQEKKIAIEFDEGSNDLNYRISFFEKKIDKSKIAVDSYQKNLYDNIFDRNKNVPDIIKNDDKSQEDISKEIHNDIQNSSNKNNNIDNWLKKLYIKISKSIHPDITMHINSKELRKKFDELYLIAKEGYENNKSADVIMVAYELDIDLKDISVSDIINESLNKKKNKIAEYKNKLGWQWYHVPNEDKDLELKKILKMLGFDFTEEMIQEVIKSRKSERKTGQRPEKNNVKNKKLN